MLGRKIANKWNMQCHLENEVTISKSGQRRCHWEGDIGAKFWRWGMSNVDTEERALHEDQQVQRPWIPGIFEEQQEGQWGLSRVSQKETEEEVREVIGVWSDIQMMSGFASHCKFFGLCPRWDGKYLYLELSLMPCLKLQCKFFEIKDFVSFVHTWDFRTQRRCSVKSLNEWMNKRLNWTAAILLKDIRIKLDHCNKVGKNKTLNLGSGALGSRLCSASDSK